MVTAAQAADITAWHTGLVTGCCYHSHQNKSPLLFESLASGLKHEAGWPVYDEVVTYALAGERYEDLAIGMALEEVVLTPTELYVVGNPCSTERDQRLRPYFDRI